MKRNRRRENLSDNSEDEGRRSARNRRNRSRSKSPRDTKRSRSKNRRNRKKESDQGVFGPLLREMIMNDLKGHKDLHGLFAKIDSNKNGYLSRAEFKRAFAEMGLNAPRTELQKLIKHLDKNGDGEIDYKEFINAVGTLRKSGDAYGDALESSNLGVAGILASKLRELIDQSSHDAKSLKNCLMSSMKTKMVPYQQENSKRLSKNLGSQLIVLKSGN